MNTTKSLCLLLVAMAFFGCADIPDDLRNDAKAGDGCSGKAYTQYQFCANGVVYDLCGGTPYNPSIVACCNNHQYTKSAEFCYGGLTVYRRCGGREYNPSTERCQNEVVQSLSSSSSSVKVSSSSSVTVSSSSLSCGLDGDNVRIGDQVWMAKNLDENVSGSKCYDNEESNCAIYGRLYDWATAMALPANCNSNSCAGQIKQKHQGICPSGWHIPSRKDWLALKTAVSGLALILKDISGWKSGGGYDKCGFSALPGSWGNSDGSFGGENLGVGYAGCWMTAEEQSPSSTEVWCMYHNIHEVSGFGSDKTDLSSVRCIQD